MYKEAYTLPAFRGSHCKLSSVQYYFVKNTNCWL